jgi:hypothetical protein
LAGNSFADLRDALDAVEGRRLLQPLFGRTLWPSLNARPFRSPAVYPFFGIFSGLVRYAGRLRRESTL